MLIFPKTNGLAAMNTTGQCNSRCSNKQPVTFSLVSIASSFALACCHRKSFHPFPEVQQNRNLTAQANRGSYGISKNTSTSVQWRRINVQWLITQFVIVRQWSILKENQMWLYDDKLSTAIQQQFSEQNSAKEDLRENK